jgi:hypothetical protein
MASKVVQEMPYAWHMQEASRKWEWKQRAVRVFPSRGFNHNSMIESEDQSIRLTSKRSCDVIRVQARA